MADRSFPQANTSVRAARRFVAGELVGLSNKLCERACLLASELCTNAVVHGGSGFLVRVLWKPPVVYIAVSDASAVAPYVAEPSADDAHGRGMRLVLAFADRWGVEPTGDRPGKTVWLEINAWSPRGDVSS